ncbi:MAG: hypothetical protein P9M08_02480 [Candidatus Erginobacter occultus]|nr:hypothetical protein [Candidatus Erginobacter occultus]
MNRDRLRGLTVFLLLIPIVFFSTNGIFRVAAADLKIATQNVSKIGTFAGNQSIRIFQGLAPDIVLIQEWGLSEGTYRGYVDQAFGADFSVVAGLANPYDSWCQNNGVISRWSFQSTGYWADPNGGGDFVWAQIDLPGETDLLAVSVHLKADAGEESVRLQQAQGIKTYIEDYIAGQSFTGYVVVGGDLNAEQQYEWCMQTFATFLKPWTYRPQDRLGNEETNQSRTKPYDWILPNQLLDDHQSTLIIGAESYGYQDGIVFDSHVFSRSAPGPTPGPADPLWNLPPVLYGDSWSTVMDHMAVMKSFSVFPSPTPSPTRFITPTPTLTPKPTVRKTPTPIPTATPEIVSGPIWGRVYDRETGVGIPKVYILATNAGMGAGTYSDRGGYYSTRTLNIGTYIVSADTFEQPVYRGQYYNQKDSKIQATLAPSNTGGINFPLYRRGVYPSPTPTPSPPLLPSSIDTADYDGDGTSDLAIFRPTTGLWAVRSLTRVYFGRGGDFPVSGDYNGDGTSNFAVFRGSSGLWAARGVTRAYFGRSGDIPVPGDYRGLGTAGFGVFRPASGLWAIRNVTRAYFGRSGDLPAPFKGGGWEKEIAIFRPATGLWAVKGATRAYFGRSGDIPVPGNYQGSFPGAIQFGVFRSGAGLWAIRGLTRVYFGRSGDRPVPGNYAGTIQAISTVFRENNGLWSLKGLTQVYFGQAGDLPASGLAVNPSGTLVF